MSEQLANTNVWLAIVAIVSLIELITVAALGIMGFRLYKRATAVIDRVETAYVAPIAEKANVVVAEAKEVIRKVQHLEQKVGAMVQKVEDTAHGVGAMAERLWPVMGTFKAVSAAVSSFTHGRRRTA
jgi:uncharacterized protein YoxC